MSEPDQQPLNEPVESRLRGARAVIARRMQSSLATSAQLSFHARADVTALLEQRAAGAVSIEDRVCWAACRVLGDFPDFNATLNDKSASVYPHVNLGIAIAANDTLVVPVVPAAEQLSLQALADARAERVQRARANELTAADFKVGTFTVSNLGRGRTEQFTPILNDGQVALLGMAGMAAQPWVHNDQISVRTLLHLSLTVDHRWIDGAPANAFLTALCDHLEAV